MMKGGTVEYNLTIRDSACKRTGKFGDNLSCNAREVSHVGASTTSKSKNPPPLFAPLDQLPTTMEERCNGELNQLPPSCHCHTHIELPHSTACFSTALHEHNTAHPAAIASNSQLSWCSSSDQSHSTHNAALHRALASLKKPPSIEIDTVKKPQRPLGHVRGADSFSAVYSDSSERSITSTDARTLSMRERGRWGNSKMQQQLSGGAGSLGSHGQVQKPNLNTPQHHQHQQPLQHVQCLHCGSFSTTPVAGTGAGGGAAGGKGARSHSFGRRVRDYSWQQELLQEQKKPVEQLKEVHCDTRAANEQIGLHHHHQCEFMCCRDNFYHQYEPSRAPSAALPAPPFKLHLPSPMSWQERYMLLCQAIAAGAFVDGLHESTDEFSGPLQPRPARAGYSWAECECPACEASAGGNGSCGGGGGGSSFGQRPHNTSSAERMMELEAFSGPIGYVSESKGMAELTSIKEKLGRRGASRWWPRLPSFGKAKVSSSSAAAPSAPPIKVAGQTTAQCGSCGQRVWAATGSSEEEAEAGRLCPDCMARGRTEAPNNPAPTPPPTSARPAPTASGGRGHRFNQPPNFAFNHQHHYQKHASSLPRRWRLMKLCRYLMGFPMQR